MQLCDCSRREESVCIFFQYIPTYRNTFPLLADLTRALEGEGAKYAHPSGFSRIAEKRRRATSPFFQYLLTIELDTLCENFNSRSRKVRSPGQVKVKNVFLTLRVRSGHTRYPIGFKPSAFQQDHRYLQLVYLGCLISVTRGQVNFVTSPLQVNRQKFKSFLLNH